MGYLYFWKHPYDAPIKGVLGRVFQWNSMPRFPLKISTPAWLEAAAWALQPDKKKVQQLAQTPRSTKKTRKTKLTKWWMVHKIYIMHTSNYINYFFFLMFAASNDFQKSNSYQYFMVLNLETRELFLTPRISAHTALLPGPCFNTGLGFLVDKWHDLHYRCAPKMDKSIQIIESYRSQFSKTAGQKTETKQPQKSETLFSALPTSSNAWCFIFLNPINPQLNKLRRLRLWHGFR